LEDAEKALEKAFAISPDYAFGYLLRGTFRYNEGELPGALMLFRKAAERYDPEARDLLAQVYSMIGDAELKLNRPVAARAALQIAAHCQPSDQNLRDGIEQVFGAQSRLPASARQTYTFRSPAPTAPAARRAAWDRALTGASSGRLADAAKAFDQLSKEDENDAAAWYNLGVARAWLGDNHGALEALGRYVTLEPDEKQAAAAWALAEVLRCAQGMEDEADYLEHSAVLQIRDPQPVFGLLQEWEQSRRLIGVQASEKDGVLSALVLEGAAGLIAPGSAGQAPRLASYLLLAGGMMRLWHPNK